MLTQQFRHPPPFSSTGFHFIPLTLHRGQGRGGAKWANGHGSGEAAADVFGPHGHGGRRGSADRGAIRRHRTRAGPAFPARDELRSEEVGLPLGLEPPERQPEPVLRDEGRPPQAHPDLAGRAGSPCAALHRRHAATTLSQRVPAAPGPGDDVVHVLGGGSRSTGSPVVAGEDGPPGEGVPRSVGDVDDVAELHHGGSGDLEAGRSGTRCRWRPRGSAFSLRTSTTALRAGTTARGCIVAFKTRDLPTWDRRECTGRLPSVSDGPRGATVGTRRGSGVGTVPPAGTRGPERPSESVRERRDATRRPAFGASDLAPEKPRRAYPTSKPP